MLKHLLLASDYFSRTYFSITCLLHEWISAQSLLQQTLHDINSIHTEKVKFCQVQTAQNLLEPLWLQIKVEFSPQPLFTVQELNNFRIPPFPFYAGCSLWKNLSLRWRWTNGFSQSLKHSFLHIAEMLSRVRKVRMFAFKNENVHGKVLALAPRKGYFH